MYKQKILIWDTVADPGQYCLKGSCCCQQLLCCHSCEHLIKLELFFQMLYAAQVFSPDEIGIVWMREMVQDYSRWDLMWKPEVCFSKEVQDSESHPDPWADLPSDRRLWSSSFQKSWAKFSSFTQLWVGSLWVQFMHHDYKKTGWTQPWYHDSPWHQWCLLHSCELKYSHAHIQRVWSYFQGEKKTAAATKTREAEWEKVLLESERDSECRQIY